MNFQEKLSMSRGGGDPHDPPEEPDDPPEED